MHPKQAVILESPHRFNIAACGTKFGKTLGCSCWIVKGALEHPRTVWRWIAPIYPQAEIGYRLVKQLLPPKYIRANETKLFIELNNGSRIEFKSGERPEALEGEAVSGAVLDEFAKNRDPKGVWESNLTTLTRTNGPVWVISTPLGRNFFYTLYCWGQDENRPDFQSFNFKTSDNPYINKSVIDAAQQTLPHDVFRQYYLAEFLDDSAGVFRGIKACIKGEYEEAKQGVTYYAGVDLAKTQDFTVITICDSAGHVVYFDRFNLAAWPVQKQRIIAAIRQFNARTLVDSTGKGDPIYDDLKAAGLNVDPYVFTNHSKQNLIERLQVDIEHQVISFPFQKELIHELEVYEYEITRAGNITYNAPSGFHDDCVISLALMNWHRQSAKIPSIRYI